MSGRINRLAVAVAISAVVGGFSVARAASPLELNFWLSGPRYDAVVPLCNERAMLDEIQFRFGQKEYRFWNSSLQIVGFDKLREVAFRPWIDGSIPRRFCTGVALVSDGIARPLHYSIGEDTGTIGAGPGVEWCVMGLDRNWAYNPRCKMARP
jgi:hypothetical protein